ncbi:ABC transporter ATP-binding protein [Bdellovibrio bacteriovorus]|uniref:ABC transporter ATP-binding protein n=1 Tax=Bdellovibrio bacteriovorus TaxID=959 RepID=A0A161QFB3_BDEBC|nr:rhodanese-like domain-containing protein [Bdellovibrio bacteriovorus]KYG63557.1 ABC transporter ATP-binding protein [Bdellovibrio bacteriovorus]
MKSFVLTLISVVLFLGCQQQPTKVVSEEPVMGESVTAEKLIKGNPVILDARPPFEFNLVHVPGAINVRWEDFSSQNPKSRGLLQGDLFALARRLSLIGVDPDTKVLVLGKGPQGAGEEGRVAWTLKVLGVKEVYTVLHNSYREMNTTREVPPVQNKPYWKPVVQDELAVDFKTFKNQALNGGHGIVILDVRSSQEFALRSLAQMSEVKTPVLNIDWTSFFSEKGLPDKKIERLLSEKNIGKDTRILVISNHGVRSGAATYALQYLGFKKATNFAGGYEQWK